jgi:virginiamycin A acetyltransferase
VLRQTIKRVLNAAFLAIAFPVAVLAGFGRIKPLYTICAHVCALAPGLLGDYLRTAFYRLTLESFPMSSRISFGSFFAHPEARVGAGVYIGSYCILGRTHIGDATQIASAVQIISGQHQHVRDESGNISGSEAGYFKTIAIGPNCWIGAAAVVMADVGAGSTVGAGSVVTTAIPEFSVAVGSPARAIKSAARQAATVPE